MASHNELIPLLNALADETRLRILNLVKESEMCVCFFTEVLRAPQPKVSRHLAYLRRVGLVNVLREGKWIHYSLNWPQDPGLRSIVEQALAWSAGNKALERDRKRLEAACCQPDKFVSLQGAPLPKQVIR